MMASDPQSPATTGGRSHLRGCGAVLTGAIVALTAACTAPGASTGTPSWQSVPVQQVPGGEIEALYPLSRTEVWLTMATFDGATQTTGLVVEHISGGRAVITATPPLTVSVNFGLTSAVTAFSQRDAWFVSSSLRVGAAPTILRWNGSTWESVPSPALAGRVIGLDAVAGEGPDDIWAVGAAGSRQGVEDWAQHWDGVRWVGTAVAPGPVPLTEGPAGLASLAVVSPTDVWAAGFGSLYHWDGASWRGIAPIVPELPAGALSHILDPGLRLMAAGGQVWLWGNYYLGASTAITTTFGSFAARWTGATWKLSYIEQRENISGGGPNQVLETLAAGAASSASDAWLLFLQYLPGPPSSATGGPTVIQHNYLLHWDGAAWRRVALPTGFEDGRASILSAGSSGTIWVAGTQTGYKTFVYRWTGH